MNDLDENEFKESYAHYRHLEAQRAQQLTTFLAVTGGVGAVATFVLGGKSPLSIANADDLIPLSILTVFLQVVAIFTIAALRRLGEAREFHSNVMGVIRKEIGRVEVSELHARFDESRSKWLSVQGAAEMLVHSIAGMTALSMVLVWIYAKYVSAASTTALLIAPVGLIMFEVFVHCRLSPARKGCLCRLLERIGV